jgi:hypothetical protein
MMYVRSSEPQTVKTDITLDTEDTHRTQRAKDKSWNHFCCNNNKSNNNKNSNGPTTAKGNDIDHLIGRLILSTRLYLSTHHDIRHNEVRFSILPMLL